MNPIVRSYSDWQAKKYSKSVYIPKPKTKPWQ